MTNLEILILDANDRAIYLTTLQQLGRIDVGIFRDKQSFQKRKIHVKTILNSILSDIHNVEIRVQEIKNESLRLELREEIDKRRQRYYELYDEVEGTIF
jgi:hypothetical protein